MKSIKVPFQSGFLCGSQRTLGTLELRFLSTFVSIVFNKTVFPAEHFAAIHARKASSLRLVCRGSPSPGTYPFSRWRAFIDGWYVFWWWKEGQWFAFVELRRIWKKNVRFWPGRDCTVRLKFKQSALCRVDLVKLDLVSSWQKINEIHQSMHNVVLICRSYPQGDTLIVRS